MSTKIWLMAPLLLLTACSTAPSKDISWHEKQIQALHLQERKEPMDMATQLKNQKSCEEYGKTNWGESDTYGDWNQFTQFHYSPIYDKCFGKRTADNYKDGKHIISIFDLLSGSEGPLLSYHSWCRDLYINNGRAVDEDECSSEEEINQAWLSLIGERE